MSRASRKKKRWVKGKVPWLIKKNQSSLAAFYQQATEMAKRDQDSLIQRGWAPLEAAIEAWETMQAGINIKVS